MVYDLNGITLSTGGSGMLNVLDHGFKGDGTTDNLAAFNALIAAHPAETLYFPKGVYAFSGKLVFDQCYMELDNAELKCTASTKVDRFIEIRGKMYPPETPQQDMFIRGNGKVNANFKADDCIAVARQKCTLLDHISIQNFQRYGICGKFNDASMTNSDGQTEANLSYELMVRNCMIESSLDYPNAVGIYDTGDSMYSDTVILNVKTAPGASISTTATTTPKRPCWRTPSSHTSGATAPASRTATSTPTRRGSSSAPASMSFTSRISNGTLLPIPGPPA